MSRLLAIALLASACTPTELPDAVPTSGTRIDLPTIHFNKWTDYLALQAAVDDQCRWLFPLYDDNSTPFPPLQVFWVIYDDERDVTDGDLIEGTYFDGDRRQVSEFPDKNGLMPLGYQFPTPLQSSFLTVTYTEFSEDGTIMEAGLGKPIDAALRVIATPTDTGCEVETLHCTPDGCGEDDEWTPLTWMYLELGFLLSVQDKQFNANEPPVDAP